MRCPALLLDLTSAPGVAPFPVTGTVFLGVVSSLVIMGTIFLLIKKLNYKTPDVQRRSLDGQPIKVMTEDPPVLQREFETAMRNIDDRFAEIERDFKDHREDRRRDVAAINTRLDAVNSTASEMKGELKGITSTLSALRGEVTRALEIGARNSGHLDETQRITVKAPRPRKS